MAGALLFTDDTLMAYADGELDAATRAAIDQALDGDAALAARVRQHAVLRARIHAAFDGVLHEPIPAPLTAALQVSRQATAPVAALLPQPARRRWSWAEWGGMAASLFVGAVLAHLAWTRDPAPSWLATEGGRIVADGALAEALSGQLASLPAADVAVPISFVSTSGTYCRSFSLRAGSTMAGLACRQGERWALEVLAAEEPGAPEAGGSPGYRPAASTMPPAVLGAIEARIAGAPLDAEAERRAQAAGWQVVAKP